MRRKFIAAVTSGVLALTVMAALPTHADDSFPLKSLTNTAKV